MLISENFNTNLLDFEKNKKVQSFVDLMLHCGKVPSINKPIHVVRSNTTAINHMFLNSIVNTEVKADISDHIPRLSVQSF